MSNTFNLNDFTRSSKKQIYQYLPKFVAAFLEFQSQQEFIYPIIHTNYWLSAWVGMEIKKQQSGKLLHTYHSLGAVKYKTVKNIPEISQTRLKIEKQCLELHIMRSSLPHPKKKNICDRLKKSVQYIWSLNSFWKYLIKLIFKIITNAL